MKMIACDFCRKTQYEVECIVVGFDDVAICNECVAVAQEIIEGWRKKEKEKTDAKP